MPAIVIAAHARPVATQRLLTSVAQADVATGTSLVISIDMAAPTSDGQERERSEQVLQIANEYEWTTGAKSVVAHEQIGLVEHFHRCGDLTAEHDGIVLLEDDLLVGRGFFHWATAALEFGDRDQRVAGVGLVTPWFDGYRRMRFEPIDDGTDAVYMQVPWYDGMAWTPRMWNDYRHADIDPAIKLHAAFDELDDDEWFPRYTRYLVQTGRTFMLPRSAHATGTGAAGAHFDESTDWFQSELAVAAAEPQRFASIDESLSRYDDHMELLAPALRRLVPDLPSDPLLVDLRGTRDLAGVDADTNILTTRPVRTASRTWGVAMHPIEMNLVHDQPGEAIALARVGDVDTTDTGARAAEHTLRAHHGRGQEVRRGDALRALVPQLDALAGRLQAAPGLDSLRDRFRNGR